MFLREATERPGKRGKRGDREYVAGRLYTLQKERKKTTLRIPGRKTQEEETRSVGIRQVNEHLITKDKKKKEVVQGKNARYEIDVSSGIVVLKRSNRGRLTPR